LISLDRIINEDGAYLEEVLFLRNGGSINLVDRLDAKILSETIHNNGLTLREKKILSLYAEGLTTREIGEMFGVSHVRVVKIMARIRGKCRRYLDSV
jgi:RNA polymerase sigma factor (sigma-70 family)